MLMSKSLRFGALAAFLLVPGLASAQVTTAQPTTAQPATRVAGQQFRAKQVLGTKIMIQGNQAAGVVDDLVFDDAGNLEYLIVDNAGKLTTVPWEAAKFDLERKTAVLPLTVEQYKVIPTFTTTTYPTFYAPAYRNEIYRFYNLTPRELRRIDRRN
jgi:hypothetical protein